jgi:hypothetical protein
MDRQLVVLAQGVLSVLIIGPAIYLFSTRKKQTARDRDAEIERDFHNVFRTASPEGKEAVIKRWMDRMKCDRLEAMRLAVEEWRWHNR